MQLPVRACVTAAAAAFSLGIAAQESGWRADPQVVERASRQQPSFNYQEAAVAPYTLPDLMTAGGTVRTPEAWTGRRAEILELFREHVYGRSPGRPAQLRFQVIEENPKAMEGAATLKRVAVISTQSGREHRFELTMFLPNRGSDPVPLFLLLNNRPATNTDPTRKEKSGFWPAEAMIARGYGMAALQVGDLAPDDKDRYLEGVIRLFEGDTGESRPDNAWRGLAAWAWGASRAMDYLQTDARVDATRVAVVGHSRGGKASLWAGAEDARFAMVVSNESGEGGRCAQPQELRRNARAHHRSVSALVRGKVRELRRARRCAAGRSAHAARARGAARALCRQRERGSLGRPSR